MGSTCKICLNEHGNTEHIAREMMFGYKDEFTYIECAECGCVQLKDYRTDLSKYYPPDYFSFKKHNLTPDNLLTKYARYKWVDYGLTGKSLIGMLISKIKPLPDIYSLFRKYDIHRKSRILDVGCGSAKFLLILHRAGFQSLLGIDPNLSGDVHYDTRLSLLKKRLEALVGKFDLITFHHSLEHMPEPLAVFNKLHSLLNDTGLLVIRMPVIGYAWRYYGVNWVQLDAPRHFFLHTIKSIQTVFKKARFELIEYAYDSNEFQFWGSEQYLKNIPLVHKTSRWVNPDNSIFTNEEMRLFKQKAEALNKNMDGDQASFYFRKTQPLYVYR